MSSFELSPEAEEIWSIQLDLYSGFLTGDRARVDKHISSDGTMWDSEYVPLIFGLDGLNVVRAGRPSGEGAPKVTALDATEAVVDVWGDFGVSRHMLTVSFDDPGHPAERARVTGVWRRIDGDWMNVHNHEDVLP